jgi:hypothetical protein
MRGVQEPFLRLLGKLGFVSFVLGEAVGTGRVGEFYSAEIVGFRAAERGRGTRNAIVNVVKEEEGCDEHVTLVPTVCLISPKQSTRLDGTRARVSTSVHRVRASTLDFRFFVSPKV